MEKEKLDLIFKVHFFNEVVNTIYENNGFTFTPIELNWRDEMLQKCEEDFIKLFSAMLRSNEDGETAWIYFENCYGGFMLFILTLPAELQDKILACTINDVNQIVKSL